jgi:hypothetical protein
MTTAATNAFVFKNIDYFTLSLICLRFRLGHSDILGPQAVHQFTRQDKITLQNRLTLK